MLGTTATIAKEIRQRVVLAGVAALVAFAPATAEAPSMIVEDHDSFTRGGSRVAD